MAAKQDGEVCIVVSSSEDEASCNDSKRKSELMDKLDLGKTHKSEGSRNGCEGLAAGPSSESRPSSSDLIERFVGTLKEIINSPQERKILLKIYELEKRCPAQYLQSRKFEDCITLARENVVRDPAKVFVHIKELYDNMKLASKTRTQENGISSPSVDQLEHSEEANEKRIRRLEKLLQRYDKEIRKLKRREVSLDEMDDECSAYIYEDKLKKRCLKVWEKLCELKKCSPKLKNRVDKKFHYSGSRYPELNSEVEKHINATRVFPDYSDILKIARRVNESNSLGLIEASMQILAREIFQDVGQELKDRREKDYQDLFGSYLTDEIDLKDDPAEADPVLKETLEISYQEGQKKFKTLLQEYTEKQIQLKLEPKEVPDNEGTEDAGGDVDPDDEEEDREIENDQIEEEVYSDDENLNRFLDEPGARTPSIMLSSDDEQKSMQPDLTAEVNDETIPVSQSLSVVLEGPSGSAPSQDSGGSNGSRSCMARLKVTPKRTASVDDFVTEENSSVPPSKRICLEPKEECAQVREKHEVIILD